MTNKFTGEDIFTFKELLIPYKGQLAPKLKDKTEEQKHKEEMERRAACLDMLEEFIRLNEKTAMRKQQIAKVKGINMSKDFYSEAKYYLGNHEYVYKKACEEYKEDLQSEIEMFTFEKQNKGMRHKGRLSNVQDPETVGCAKQCSIF